MNFTKFLRSFGYAFQGWKELIQKEQNIRIQLIAGLLMLCVAFLLDFNSLHWLFVLFLVFFIPALEIINTLFEEVANLLNLPYESTRYLRNLSAGLVLWFSMMAIIVGVIIIFNYI